MLIFRAVSKFGFQTRSCDDQLLKSQNLPSIVIQGRENLVIYHCEKRNYKVNSLRTWLRVKRIGLNDFNCLLLLKVGRLKVAAVGLALH